jgi:multidrug efflux pump subunit AcrA (membrane-fusion protein)
VVRAPFTGVVSARMADPGDLAVPGRPLLRMVRQSTVRVRGAIPPELAITLRQGTSVDLTLGDQRIPATVSRVFPAMQGSHLGTFEVDVAHPTPGYVAGAMVGVDLHLSTGSGLLLPLDALLEGDAGTHAFVVDSAAGADTLRVVPVTVTARSLDQAIVAGALCEGDRVVVARPSRLMNLAAGMGVRPVDASPER